MWLWILPSTSTNSDALPALVTTSCQLIDAHFPSHGGIMPLMALLNLSCCCCCPLLVLLPAEQRTIAHTQYTEHPGQGCTITAAHWAAEDPADRQAVFLTHAIPDAICPGSLFTFLVTNGINKHALMLSVVTLPQARFRASAANIGCEK